MPGRLTLKRHDCKVVFVSETRRTGEHEMAEYLTSTEIRNYPLSTGETADLIELIGTGTPAGWVAPTYAPEIGTVAYVEAMGQMRRGVVTKTTKSKVYVTFTTQGALTKAAEVAVNQPIRVQTTIADTNWV